MSEDWSNRPLVGDERAAAGTCTRAAGALDRAPAAGDSSRLGVRPDFGDFVIAFPCRSVQLAIVTVLVEQSEFDPTALAALIVAR
jgi:hypothetical protein